MEGTGTHLRLHEAVEVVCKLVLGLVLLNLFVSRLHRRHVTLACVLDRLPVTPVPQQHPPVSGVSRAAGPVPQRRSKGALADIPHRTTPVRGDRGSVIAYRASCRRIDGRSRARSQPPTVEQSVARTLGIFLGGGSSPSSMALAASLARCSLAIRFFSCGVPSPPAPTRSAPNTQATAATMADVCCFTALHDGAWESVYQSHSSRHRTSTFALASPSVLRRGRVLCASRAVLSSGRAVTLPAEPAAFTTCIAPAAATAAACGSNPSAAPSSCA